MEEMHMNVILNGSIILVELSGYIDSTASIILSERLKDFEKGLFDMIFIINSLEYLCSAGVAFFMTLCSVMNKNGKKLIFVGMSHQIRRVFQLVGYTANFKTADSRSAALELLGSLS